MTIPEAAALLGLATSTLRHQIKNRKLKAHRMGRGWYVAPEEVDRYRRENRTRDITHVIGNEPEGAST